MKSRRKFNFWGILSLTATVWLVSLSPAFGYESQFADNARRVRLRWRGAVINLALSNSLKQPPANFKAGGDSAAAAVQRSLATWERAAGVRFNAVWTDKQSISLPGGAGDGVSLITVAATAENVLSFQGEHSETAGQTRVFYNKRGAITEADIVFNPYQQFSLDGSVGTYDFESALTHELGHLLGLDHSTVPAATMYAEQGKNGIFNLSAFAPRTLSEDDLAGVRALYDERAGKTQNCCGTITGNLAAPEMKGDFDSQVWAEDAETGRFVAVVSAKPNGAFQISGLRAGKYRILARSIGNSLNFKAASGEEIGEATVSPGATIAVNQISPARAGNFRARLVGFNGQLSTLAVPLNPGRSYLIYVGGENLSPDDLAEDGVSVGSPYLTVNRASIVKENFGSDVSVLSFQVEVDAQAPKGEYSLQIRKKNGEVAYLIGCLTIDDVLNQWQHHLIN